MCPHLVHAVDHVVCYGFWYICKISIKTTLFHILTLGIIQSVQCSLDHDSTFYDSVTDGWKKSAYIPQEDQEEKNRDMW